ncbi:MAG: glycosyltransferase [Desulfovibrio sp.]
MQSYYFSKYEDRRPYKPVPYSAWREFFFQYFVTLNFGVGIWYFHWRWTQSLNPDALWFSIPLALAETLAFGGTVFFMINLWSYKDTPQQEPPTTVNEIVADEDRRKEDRSLHVDVFIPTYTEPPELVRYSIRDALGITYPHPIDIRVHVLDDGKREEMAIVASEEGVNYITREDNRGFKAGNLRNAMEVTSGDIIVILDADTRPFPEFLERTLGYFRDPNVAWVQTPQWFYDTVEGTRLGPYLRKFLWLPGQWIGRGLEFLIGPVHVNQDLFGSDPRMFYDCILRKRQNFNAAFCCGAGSLHRREAVQQAALLRYMDEMDDHVEKVTNDIESDELQEAMTYGARKGFLQDVEVTPYKYHVSEDIYTSLLLHADTTREWKSVHHPEVLSKMLSPQDLLAYMTQNFKYAGGTLDLLRRENPIMKKGLSAGQKLMYFSSVYSYFAAFWMIVFLITPPVFFFTGIVPVKGFDLDFFIHILLFQIIGQITFLLGTWGVNTLRDVQYYVAFFPLNIKAIWTVLKGKNISFKVTPKTTERKIHLDLVIPQLICIVLNLAGILWYAGRMYLGYPSDTLGFIIATFWSVLNMNSLMVIIRAAFWSGGEDVELS